MDTQASPRRRAAVAAAAVVAALAVVALVILVTNRSASSGATGNAPPAPSVDATAHLREGSPAPAFSGTTTDGGHVDLAALKGRPVMLNFFASWCTNCRAELPLVEQRWMALKGTDLQLVAVNYNDSGDGAGFLRQLGVTFPALLDADSRIGHVYGVTDLPVSVFIGRDGVVRSVHRGQLSADALDTELRAIR